MSVILVTGGTGTLGQAVVPALRARGHEVRMLTRRKGVEGGVLGDLARGEGLEAATAGAEVVVHAASQAVGNTRATDVEGTRRLLEAARKAAVTHFLYISIAGVDRARGYPYYAAKREAERIVEGSGVPWTVLRATQFHELLPLRMFPVLSAAGVLVIGRGWRIQPVDVRDVAERIAEVVAGPGGYLPEFGGPEVMTWGQIAGAWRAAGFSRRPVLQLPLPGAFARGSREGLMLARDPEPRGTRSFGAWLGERSRARSAG